jgi:hypothetical protein
MLELMLIGTSLLLNGTMTGSLDSLMVLGSIGGSGGGAGDGVLYAMGTDAVGAIINAIKPWGWGLATIGVIVWAVAKMASGVLPEAAQQTQGTISKIAMGALTLGLAPTILEAIQNAIGT